MKREWCGRSTGGSRPIRGIPTSRLTAVNRLFAPSIATPRLQLIEPNPGLNIDRGFWARRSIQPSIARAQPLRRVRSKRSRFGA
jgi:hypothetical protein